MGLMTAAALMPAKPVPSPAPIPAKKVTKIVIKIFIIFSYSGITHVVFCNRCKEYESCFQLVFDRFIVMSFLKNVKWQKDIFLQQVKLYATVYQLFGTMDENIVAQ